MFLSIMIIDIGRRGEEDKVRHPTSNPELNELGSMCWAQTSPWALDHQNDIHHYVQMYENHSLHEILIHI